MPKKKKNLLIILLYLIVFTICTLIFLGLFHIPAFNKWDVFFFRGCIFLGFCTILSFIFTSIARLLFKKLDLTLKDAIVVSSMFFGITLGWFTLIPTTVERSISVFMLSYMDDNFSEKGITMEEFEDIFYKKYIQDFGAIEKRFHEQEVSGNIELVQNTNTRYAITKNGQFVVSLFRFFSDLFNTERGLVYPNEY